MDRILLVVASAFLYSSSSFALDQDPAPEGFQYSLASYHEDGSNGSKLTAWKGKYGQLTSAPVIIEERSLDYSLARIESVPGAGIGLGVAPFYGTHGVFRTSSNEDKYTYIAVGFTIDEMAAEEAGRFDSRDDSVFAYGFGIKNSSYNIEYMMSLDENSFDFSAISLGFTSAF